MEEFIKEDLDALAADNLKAISLTKLYRERQEIISYGNLEKNIRDELQAYDSDIPPEMAVGDKRIQVGEDIVEEGSSNNTGGTPSPGGSHFGRMPHLTASETPNWNPTHLSNAERQE
jgi:hypothetical protein